jgi:hypothetical protein
MKLLGKSEEEYDAMTPKEKEDAFEKLKANAGTKEQGNIAADTSRKSFAEKFFGGVTDSFRNSISIAMGSTDFSSASVEFKDGTAHIRTCFTAGTKIKTKSGYKSIETIQTGDIVASANEHTGKISYKKVVQTFIRQSPRIYKLTYNDGTTLETTGDHPFFINDKGWTTADKLSNGDISPTWAGLKKSSGVVEKEIAFSESKDTISDRVSRLVMKESLAVVDIEVIEEDTTVYNFEVEDDHTYFVTEAEVWVHNAPTEYQKGYEYGVRKSLVANADVIPLAINSAASNMNAGISGNSDQLELPMFSDLYDKSVRSKELSKSNDPAEFERGFEDGNFFGNVSQFAISLPIAIRSLKNALGLRFTKPIAMPSVQQEVKVGTQGVKAGKLSKIDEFIDVTSHRKDHLLNRHRFGAGKPGKTEFPRNWNDDRILHHVSDVATDPNAIRGVGKWNSPYAIGTRDGIRIRVDFYPANHPEYAGKISTAYPLP